MGLYCTNYRDRLDISYILYHPQKPVVTTRASKYVFTDTLPFGENAIVAISTYTGYNQEDSLIFNKRSIERGMFRSTSLRKFASSISKNQNTSQDDIFTKPDPDKVIGIRHGSYDKLNLQGYVPEETVVSNGDILLAKIKPIQQDIKSNSEKSFKDDSEVYKSHAQGVVDRVHTNILNKDSYETRKMLVRSERQPRIGDKFCCYTPEHEVLTSEGWKSITKITKQDKVATLIDGHTLEYTNPTDIQEYDYDGDMYCIKSDQVDLMVTPNHRMYVGDREGCNFKIELAEDCYGKVISYKKNVKYTTLTERTGFIDHETEEFILPADGNLDEKHLSLMLWVQLYGMWITKGCVFGDNVTIITNKEKIKEICNTMGFEIKKYNTCEYNLIDKRLVKYLESQSMKSNTKYLPKWVWELKPEFCRELVDSMMLDNSTKRHNTKKHDTSSIKLANDFQRLCLHAGYSCNITKCRDTYSMTVIKDQDTHLVNINEQEDSLIEYTGKVHCCTVNGDGVIYVRRNKIPVWCGNSRSGQKGTCGILLKGTDMCHTRRGLTPDLILNPNAIPSRMTIGQLIECLIGKVATLKREEADGTPFEDRNIEKIKEELGKLGYRHDCTEYMYNGMTGEMMNVPIFIGPTYYNRLKHMVEDKIHCLTLDHEVLTEDGWVTYDKIDKNTKVATLVDNKLVYDNPIDVLYYPDHKGLMFETSDNNISLKVTASHRMWASVFDIVDNEWSDYDFILARDLVGKNVRYMNRDKTFTVLGANSKLYKEKCPVFCLQVPSEVFYVRRNGKEVWTGNSRARGPRTLLTHQAPEGRARAGGLRMGEMERDALIAHGISMFIKEKLMDNSDAYSTYVCGKCGLFAQRANRRNNKKYPQNTDIYFCQQCNNYNDVHKVMIPYAFKLMIQELMSMCIAPRLRVEKGDNFIE